MVSLVTLTESSFHDFPSNVAISSLTLDCNIDITYSMFKKLSNDVSSNLKGIINFKPHQFIGIALDCDFTFPIVIFGILKLDCAFVALDLLSTFEFNEKVIKKLNIKFIITNKFECDFIKRFAIVKELSILDEKFCVIDLGESKSLCEWPVLLAYSVQTSGSTGIPKIIRVPHQAIVPNIVHLSKLLNITPNDQILLCSAPTFDPCYVELFLALSNGATLRIIGCSGLFGAAKLLRDAACGVTLLQTTPSIFRQLSLPTVKALQRLRIILLGGEECPSEKELSSWDFKDTKIYNIYGISEVSCWAAICLVWPRLPYSYLEPLDQTMLLVNSHNSENVGPLFEVVQEFAY